jgi:hypothetical protein
VGFHDHDAFRSEFAISTLPLHEILYPRFPRFKPASAMGR